MLRADIECLAKTFRVTIRGSLSAEINAAGQRLSFFIARPATTSRADRARRDLADAQRDQMAALVTIAPDFEALAAAPILILRVCHRRPRSPSGSALSCDWLDAAIDLPFLLGWASQACP